MKEAERQVILRWSVFSTENSLLVFYTFVIGEDISEKNPMKRCNNVMYLM